MSVVYRTKEICNSHLYSFSFCLFFIFFSGTSLWGQRLVLKLDTKDHLPDNHVYSSITDRLGYIWFATPKGVVKYNGYNCKTFGINEGLPTEDNWYLLEDRSGRIWLNNISNEIGYIKNDIYHRAARFENILYPRLMVQYRNGIALLGRGYYSESSAYKWEYIIRDNNEPKVINLGIHSEICVNLNSACDIISFDDPETVSLRSVDRQGRTSKATLFFKVMPDSAGKYGECLFFNNFICFLDWHSNFFYAADVKEKVVSAKRYYLPDSKEHIVYSYWLDNDLYIITERNVYVYDGSLRLSASYSIGELTGNEKTRDQNYCIFRQYPLWGDMLCTTDKGVYIRTRSPAIFKKKVDINLKDFTFVGLVHDTLGYWWDNNKHLISIVKEGKVVQGFCLPSVNRLQKVEAISGDTLLLTCMEGVFLLKGKVLMPYPVSVRHALQVKRTLKSSVVVPGKTAFLIYGSQNWILAKVSFQKSKMIGWVGTKSMCYDKLRDGLWLYHNSGIVFYDIKTDTFQFINYGSLLKMGIRKVEAIAIDPVYGNVFIKDFDKIYLLSEDFKSVRPLLTQYRHRDAKIIVNENRLIVGGRVGLLSLAIYGKGKFKAPDIYENTKDHYYNTLNSLQVSGDYALLKTDKGLFELKMKQQTQSGDSARIIAAFTDTAFRLKNNDTLLLESGAFSVQLDLINPNGRGKPAFSYAWERNKQWQAARNNEISLDKLKPYHWYKLYINPRDDVWNGNIIEVRIYKKPFWWQTYYFIAGLLLLIFVFCTLLIALTRRFVLKKQLEKQLMLELSLDATYAKINPHFIFNSLSIALHHIKANKTGDAARYINRFSRLLRSYLKSSRLRYISIRDEVTHLEDYIVLQQERFENGFTYAIIIEDAVDSTLKIPTLLLQPFVENAIRHGLWHKGDNKHLSVSFRAILHGLCICIEDNGVGRKMARELNKDHTSESYGDELVNKLVYLFNTYEKINLHIDYVDKGHPETGTIVKINIQYLNQ